MSYEAVAGQGKASFEKKNRIRTGKNRGRVCDPSGAGRKGRCCGDEGGILELVVGAGRRIIHCQPGVQRPVFVKPEQCEDEQSH